MYNEHGQFTAALPGNLRINLTLYWIGKVIWWMTAAATAAEVMEELQRSIPYTFAWWNYAETLTDGCNCSRYWTNQREMSWS